MQAAVLEKPVATGALDADRLRAIVLVRIASAGRGVAEAGAGRRSGAARRAPAAAARWRALLDREIEALAAAGLIARRRRPRIEASAGRRRPRRHLPRAQGRSAALVERRARRAPGRQGARAGARAGQAAQGAGDARRPARRHRAARLRPQDQGRADAVAPARRRWRPWPWSAPSATRSRPVWPASSAFSAKAGRLLAAQLAQEAARLRHRQPPGRRAGRRARRRRASRVSAALRLGRAAALSRRRREAGRAGAAPGREGGRRRGRAWSSPRRHRRRRSPAGPISPASPRRCAGTPPARRRAGPATARPTSPTSGAPPRAAARLGPLARSSSSACWPRRTAPASLVLANADLKDNEHHQGPAGLRRRLQERRVPFHPGRRLTPQRPPHQVELRFHALEAHIAPQADRLSAAFEHSITWEDDLWRADPVDVEAVHAPARRKFAELLDAVTAERGARRRRRASCCSTASRAPARRT